jgi:uncharacterized small protein (DUF1192 family)
MAEPKKPNTFILSDDSVNESGFRIDTEGIDISQFKLNPIMLYMHNRANEWTNPELLPIGIWKNIRKEGGKLLADAEFDMQHKFAAEVARKVEIGHLKACSVGIRVLAISDDEADLQKGQTRSTITKSKLLEASIVDIPRNGNALKLAFEDGADLTELGGVAIEKMNNILPFIKSKLNMKIVLSTLGLKEDATEVQALAAVTELKNSITQLQEEKTKLEAEMLAFKEQKATEKCVALVEKAITEKKITLSDKDNWLKLAKSNYETTEAALGTMKGFTSLAGKIESSKSDTTILSDSDKYEDMWKADKLLAWEKENPEEFERCQNAYYETINQKHPRKK